MGSPPKTSASSGAPARQGLSRIALVLAGTVLALLPIVLHLQAPARGGRTPLQVVFAVALYALPALVVGWSFWRERELPLADKLALFIVLAFLTRWMNQVHYVLVDSATGLFPYSNAVWQQRLHDDILKLDPAALPHSYRFFANSIIRLFEQASLSYEAARWVYRETFVFLLALAVYRYARLFLAQRPALVTLLLVALVYPFSVLRYAGQPIDPLSHLSFVLAFIFLERRQFGYLVLALAIGSLAKETVLGMTGFFVLFRRDEPRYIPKAALLVALTFASYLGVRWFVLRGIPSYADVSGVGLDHVLTNLRSGHWFVLTFYTLGLFVPFLALGWRQAARSLRQTIVYTFLMIMTSSLFYSWLGETRNLLPVAVPLAVVMAGHLLGWERGEREAPGPSAPQEKRVC